MLARFPRPNHATLVAYLALSVALGGSALAAAGLVGSDGKVHACVSHTGALKVVKAGKKCPKGTSALAWNQQGPQGAQGPQGLQGVLGPKGDTGPSTGPAGGDLTGNYPDPTIAPGEPWHEVVHAGFCGSDDAFCGGWGNRPNTGPEDYNSVGYYRDRLGIVHLKGFARCSLPTAQCDGGTYFSYGAIFFLPAGYRPAARHLFNARTATAVDRVDVHSCNGDLAGAVQYFGSDASDFVALDGISFRAAC